MKLSGRWLAGGMLASGIKIDRSPNAFDLHFGASALRLTLRNSASHAGSAGFTYEDKII